MAQEARPKTEKQKRSRKKTDYSSFIQKITHLKKTDDGKLVQVTTQYMTVAGRIKEFTDLHREQNKKFKFTRKFEIDPQGNIICHAKVFSEIFGTAEATAAAYGKTVVDKTNPYENAETSAYGRCLGFFGIGILESIATYEEVKDILEPQAPITPSQLSYLYKIKSQKGILNEEMVRLLKQRYDKEDLKSLTKQEASDLIDFLTKESEPEAV
jgi:hypothetical protein